ncbi:MAG: hypothetical protein GF310_04870 [candidate division Zixibacteria bacterium]|nr:hypothetical protein [candidate division Zixibacteria bacterium]
MIKFIGLILSLLIVMQSMAWAGDGNDLKALSPQKAKNYSLIGTLIPLGLCTTSLLLGGSSEESENSDVAALGFITGWLGLWFGPGSGYLYAHHPWGFWRGALIRIGGTGLVIVSMAVTWDNPEASGGWEIFIGGTAALLGSAFYDIVQAGKSAEEYNRKNGFSRVSVKPLYFPDEKAPGLVVSFNF